jgi:hypothetical protein
VEAKQRSQKSVIGWVTKIANAAVGLGYICSRWHSLQYQGRLTSGRRPVVKIIAESLPQYDEKHIVPTPFSMEKG